MGWEWHNRLRAINGKFKPSNRVFQLHFWVTKDVYEQIKRLSIENRQSISEYINGLVMQDMIKSAEALAEQVVAEAEVTE